MTAMISREIQLASRPNGIPTALRTEIQALERVKANIEGKNSTS